MSWLFELLAEVCDVLTSLLNNRALAPGLPAAATVMDQIDLECSEWSASRTVKEECSSRRVDAKSVVAPFAPNNLLDTRNGTINDDAPDDLLRINLLAPPFNVLPVV